MGGETKFVLTIDGNGLVVKVQQLGDDGSLTDVQVNEFFSQVTLPSGSFSGTGTVVIKPAPDDGGPPTGPQGPVVGKGAPPPPPPPPGDAPSGNTDDDGDS